MCGDKYFEIEGREKRAEEILEDYGYTFLLVSDETISKISKFKNDRNFNGS